MMDILGTHCLEPPPAGDGTLLEPIWDGEPVVFDTAISYTCVNRKFELNFNQETIDVHCRPDNKWDETNWPQCVESEC
jgi:hypothetical protein